MVDFGWNGPRVCVFNAQTHTSGYGLALFKSHVISMKCLFYRRNGNAKYKLKFHTTHKIKHLDWDSMQRWKVKLSHWNGEQISTQQLMVNQQISCMWDNFISISEHQTFDLVLNHFPLNNSCGPEISVRFYYSPHQEPLTFDHFPIIETVLRFVQH